MSQEIIRALNEDIALELAASTRYMWHHVMAKGIDSPEIREIFKKVAIVEMKHAEAFAERIAYLGGAPAATPAEIKVGGDLRQMMRDDLEAERRVIKRYKEHIKLCQTEGDVVTKRLLEEVVANEEEHEDTWSSILEE